jgi:hypothetical protein
VTALPSPPRDTFAARRAAAVAAVAVRLAAIDADTAVAPVEITEPPFPDFLPDTDTATLAWLAAHIVCLGGEPVRDVFRRIGIHYAAEAAREEASQ